MLNFYIGDLLCKGILLKLMLCSKIFLRYWLTNPVLQYLQRRMHFV